MLSNLISNGLYFLCFYLKLSKRCISLHFTDEKPEVWNCATADYGIYCQFPFIHNGVMHHNCINLNEDEPMEVHCASSTLGNGIAKDVKKCLLDSCVLGTSQVLFLVLAYTNSNMI